MGRRSGGQTAFSPDTVDRLVSASWRQAWDESPALLLVTVGPTHLLGYQNGAARALVGARTLGRPLGESFPEVPAEGLEALTEVLHTGEVMEIPRRRVSLRDRQGGCLDMRFVLAPLGSPPDGVAIISLDVSAEVRAEHTACRSQLLADISAAIIAANSPSAGLQSLTDGLVPALADAAAVYVIPDPTWDRSASAEKGPPEVLSLTPSLAALGPLPPPAAPDTAAAWGGLLASGNPLIFPVEESTLPSLAPDPASADWLRAAAVHSIAVVPLVAAGALTGALVLLAAGARPAFADIDLPFLESVAARAGVAISQVRAALQQRDIALKLQRALLPQTPPSLSGVSVAARYVAGAPEVEVGGDWWDVHHLGGGRIGVGIGDVCGRGIAAAAVMGQARAAMRAAGLAALAPQEVLALLDAQLTEILSGPGADRAGPQFATACYGVVDTELGTVRASSAGHLPLLLRRDGGDVVTTSLPIGPPLGLGRGGYRQVELPLGAGDTLLMFTDGLVESRTQEVDDGIAALATALQRLGGAGSLEEVADGLLHQMIPDAAAGPDDVALVLLRRDGSC